MRRKLRPQWTQVRVFPPAPTLKRREWDWAEGPASEGDWESIRDMMVVAECQAWSRDRSTWRLEAREDEEEE